MQTVSNANFGPLIAYLVPGATALWGFSLFSPTLAGWFAATPENAPTISGFLYLTVTSLTIGMTITAVRWAIVDQLHALTGLPPPKLDFSGLASRVDAFSLLIEIHYRHYQFYSNMFVAIGIAYICHRIHIGTRWHIDLIDPGLVLLEAIFFLTSRDTLRKYYQRTQQLLSRRHALSNGRLPVNWSCNHRRSVLNSLDG